MYSGDRFFVLKICKKCESPAQGASEIQREKHQIRLDNGAARHKFPYGLSSFTILGALAQMEREIIRNRVMAGLQNAKAKGKWIGRERKRNDVLIHSLLEAGLSFREIGRIAKCSNDSVSAAKKELLAKKEVKRAEEAMQVAAPGSSTETGVVREDSPALLVPVLQT